MMRWLITFLIVGIVAGLIGFTGLAFAIIKIAKVVFYICLVLVVVTLGMYFMKKPDQKV